MHLRIMPGCRGFADLPAPLFLPVTNETMRRLLLLLLAFLLPLQLLAATVGDLPSGTGPGNRGAAVFSGVATGPAEMARAGEAAGGKNAVPINAAIEAELSSTAVAASDQPAENDDSNFPNSQAECEEHAIPARIATLDAAWQPFPHLFAAPLIWPSSIRDLLRPPPLA